MKGETGIQKKMGMPGVWCITRRHVLVVLGFCGFLLFISPLNSAFRTKDIPLLNSIINQKRIISPKTQIVNNTARIQSSAVNMYSYLDIVRKDCGQLCNTSRPGIPGPFFNYVTAPIDCVAIFKNEHIDKNHGLKHAPRKIPDHLRNDFTMNGRLGVSEWYFDQLYLGGKARTPVWTVPMLQRMVSLAQRGVLGGNYGAAETNCLRDGLKQAPGVKGGRVLVIGSEVPWVEACVLEAGAKDIVTLEYGAIKSYHPQIKTLTPSEFRMRFLKSELGLFDAVVTYSSVEHSGLGRYGDALNPWGDIIAVARAWCVAKENASLTIGVMYDYENDNIKFNAGRYYGKIRYPYLVTNWKLLYKGRGLQRVFVFTKGKPGESTTKS